ncbi:hypothetical protein BH10PLA2_BH10PLA2_27540 [soil metagenome]
MDRQVFVPGGILRQIKTPWVPLAVGAGILFVTFAIQQIFNVSIIPVVFIGLLAVAVGVAVRPGNSLVLLAAFACGLLGIGSLIVEWDSIRMVLGVLSAIALVSAGLMALPRTWRRVAVSFMILFHFANISCAVMNVNPSPWLTNYLWAHVFQYYANFTYMTNAYHFYAPEPGPGILLWFDVHYDDGSQQWVKLPVRDNQRWLLSYQRRLSLPEQINQTVTALPGNDAVQSRALAGNRDGIPFYYSGHGQVPHPTEYRPLVPSAALTLESYARHVARTTPHPTDPERKVVGVKIYRVVHRMLNAKELALGLQPDKKWLYLPFYQGEYDVEGNLKNAKDPYLYWLIPIVNQKNPFLSSGEGVEMDTRAALHQDDDILDCIDIHSKLPTILPLDNPVPGGPANPIPGGINPPANPQQGGLDGVPKLDPGFIQGGNAGKNIK